MCACAISKLIPREFLCNWRLQKVPYGGTRITQNNTCQKALCDRCPARKVCVTDVLRNQENKFPNNKNMCLIILGPIHPSRKLLWNEFRIHVLCNWNENFQENNSPKQLVRVILRIANEYVNVISGKLIPEKYVHVTEIYFSEK